MMTLEKAKAVIQQMTDPNAPDDDVIEEYGIQLSGQFAHWDSWEETIDLEGSYTADQLDALAWWMRQHRDS